METGGPTYEEQLRDYDGILVPGGFGKRGIEGMLIAIRELRGVEELGGTMRLGAWTCKIEPGTLAHRIYGQLEISERSPASLRV